MIRVSVSHTRRRWQPDPSQRPVQNVVNVGSQSCGIHRGRSSPALNQYCGWNGAACERSQLGDRWPSRVTVSASPRATRSRSYRRGCGVPGQ